MEDRQARIIADGIKSAGGYIAFAVYLGLFLHACMTGHH